MAVGYVFGGSEGLSVSRRFWKCISLRVFVACSVLALCGTVIAQSGVVNAASYAPLIAPGSFVAIYGQNLADAADSWDSAITDGKTLPTSLGGV
jgi:hypothetical protein